MCVCATLLCSTYHLCVCLLCSGGDTGLVEITSVYVPLQLYLSLSPFPLDSSVSLSIIFQTGSALECSLLVVLPHVRSHMGGFDLQGDKSGGGNCVLRDYSVPQMQPIWYPGQLKVTILQVFILSNTVFYAIYANFFISWNVIYLKFVKSKVRDQVGWWLSEFPHQSVRSQSV